ncbi:MAG: ATP-binding protein [Verrucomicrobia bacterium]|nr:ATP-binding protein [Verrucomicrobiota bacterium]MBS0637452.1 ATP-binding protein [Verrucomicrobiota bacterium]
MNIEKLLSLPESKTLEFKRDLSSLDPILKTIVAFANTAGGVLIIGRSPDGKLSGIEGGNRKGDSPWDDKNAVETRLLCPLKSPQILSYLLQFRRNDFNNSP